MCLCQWMVREERLTLWHEMNCFRHLIGKEFIHEKKHQICARKIMEMECDCKSVGLLLNDQIVLTFIE